VVIDPVDIRQKLRYLRHGVDVALELELCTAYRPRNSYILHGVRFVEVTYASGVAEDAAQDDLKRSNVLWPIEGLSRAIASNIREPSLV
jgi:hypothetical protein